jgi:RimJ/RimL family protein N-acetyltransferase
MKGSGVRVPPSASLVASPVVPRLRLRIRPIEPEDKAALAAGFDRLSEESRYRRFLSAHPRLSASDLRYLTEVDHHDHEALAALDARTGDGVGVARFIRDAARPDSAEIAVAVADDWHGRGVGTALLHRLADRAREEGIGRFTAVMLASNAPMAHLLHDLGATRVLDRDQGEVELAVDLPERGVGSVLRGWLRSAARGALRPRAEETRP